MTGFGDASGTVGATSYHAEVRSVNNKYLKSTVRLPESLQSLEPEFEQMIRATVSRGSVVLTVSISVGDESAACTINTAALRRYAEQVAEATGRSVEGVDPSSLVTLPGVLQDPGDEEHKLAKAREDLRPLVEMALAHMVAMREREGLALREDLAGHLGLIRARLDEIESLAPGVAREYERRLKSRMEALLSEYDIRTQQADLVREVAVYAEKTDIAEEIARLGEHLNHFNELLESGDGRPLGRTMDFLAQELLREANTISSKSPDAAISRLIVDVKGAIDRIKEQVQNAE